MLLPLKSSTWVDGAMPGGMAFLSLRRHKKNYKEQENRGLIRKSCGIVSVVFRTTFAISDQGFKVFLRTLLDKYSAFLWTLLDFYKPSLIWIYFYETESYCGQFFSGISLKGTDLLIHSVVSLPDFHMQTHWSGQSEIPVETDVIHIKNAARKKVLSSLTTDIFKCLHLLRHGSPLHQFLGRAHL